MPNHKDIAPVEKDEAMRTLFEDFQAMCKANGLVGFKDIETAYIAGRADQSKLFVERYDHREEVVKKVVEALKTFIPVCVRNKCEHSAIWISSMTGSRLCDEHKKDSSYIAEDIGAAVSAISAYDALKGEK